MAQHVRENPAAQFQGRVPRRRLSGDHEQRNKASCWSFGLQCHLDLEYAASCHNRRGSPESGNAVLDGDLAHVSPLMHRQVIPNGNYHFSRADEGERGTTYRRTRYRTFSQPGGIWAYRDQSTRRVQSRNHNGDRPLKKNALLQGRTTLMILRNRLALDDVETLEY
jgi:hypothetical protein